MTKSLIFRYSSIPSEVREESNRALSIYQHLRLSDRSNTMVRDTHRLAMLFSTCIDVIGTFNPVTDCS
jgi:hypothetical protein